MSKKIKILIHSNYSRLKTGFGKNMRNILLSLYNDPEFEIVEAANGLIHGADAKTPWKSYGTAPSDKAVRDFVEQNGARQKAAAYGFYEIDKIVDAEKPDIYIGIEDIWAFNHFAETKPWWNTTHKIIWTTLDSLPIIPDAYSMSEKCDKFLVWASFAEEEMKKNGCQNVQTLHGTVDISNFHPIEKKKELKSKFGLENNFVIGFVFKNQLRKSVPNLLNGFKLFKEENPQSNPKLILHTDWADKNNGWDIPSFISEMDIDPNDVLCCYSCESCGDFSVLPFEEGDKDCPFCNNKKTFKTKNVLHGITETQLNILYNLMDVYCHPFTSGGQEIPLQEAKACGVITLATEYSCGLDSCYPHQGGLPLSWSEYREPYSQFIKASTCPKDICYKLANVFYMDEHHKSALSQAAVTHVKKEFSRESVVEKLKGIIKEILAEPIKTTQQKTLEEKKKIQFSSFLEKEKKDRLLLSVCGNEEDVFLCSSLLSEIKKTYPEKDIYFAVKPEHKNLIIGNPFVYKILDHHSQMENFQLMEGKTEQEGYFEISFSPCFLSKKYKDFIHNDKDTISLNLYAHS